MTKRVYEKYVTAIPSLQANLEVLQYQDSAHTHSLKYIIIL